MDYKMKVWISNPEAPEGMNTDIYLELYCEFWYNPDTYGNGHYFSVKGTNFWPLSYDIRYDKDFNRNDKEGYLKAWANTYWSGKNGAYKVKSITIEKVS